MEVEPSKIYTGVPDVDREILQKLSDNELNAACRVNKYLTSVCDEQFWNNRIQKIHNVNLSKFKEKHLTFEQLYQILQNQKNNESLLSEASRRGYIPLIKELLSEGVNIHYKNDLPLVIASEAGQYATVKLLLENGANVDHSGVGMGVFNVSALYVAASWGNIKIVKLLIKYGENIRSVDISNSIRAAVEYKHINVLKFLFKDFDDPYVIENEFLLQTSAKNGDFHTIKFLVEYLLKNNIDLDIIDSALEYAVSENHIDIVNYLLDNGGDVNTWDEFQGSLLEIAVTKQYVDMLELLFKFDVDIPTDNEDEVWNVATKQDNITIVSMLLDTGKYNKKLKSKGLINAAEHGLNNIVKLLLSSGANINISSGEPMGIAIQKGHYSTVELLLQNGAKVKYGFHRAMVNARKDIIKLLNEYYQQT